MNVLIEDAVHQLGADRSLSPGARVAVIKALELIGNRDLASLCSAAIREAISKDRTPTDYVKSLRMARAALQMEPWSWRCWLRRNDVAI